MLAGRIDVQVDGWPMSFVAEGKNLILNAGGFRQLLTLQRRWKGLFKPLRQCFTRADIHLCLFPIVGNFFIYCFRLIG